MDERPESIEISSGDNEMPWGQPSDNAASEGALLSGNVSSFVGQDGNSPFQDGANKASKGPSNGAWFAIGLILVPILLWIAMNVTFELGWMWGGVEAEELFVTLGLLLYPATLIGCLVWGFTRGNKYFAWGVLASLVGVPLALFGVLILFLFLIFGAGL